ncbi:MAG: hypothetical protein HY769_09635 [Candidatus Stahlbacteria bacterium]|nr:hypothetical protein [Candidatus Stahlbacteria bacterium]
MEGLKQSPEEVQPQVVYEGIVAKVREVYHNLVKDVPIPNLIPLVKELINIEKKNPSDILGLAHSVTTDDYVPAHAVAVSTISMHIGMVMKINETELMDLGMAGLLHCIGRPIGVEKEMKLETGHLKNKNEYVGIVEKEMAKIGVNGRVREMVKSHHEAMGPNMYPFEPIKGATKLDNILCVVDTYCTLFYHPILKSTQYPYTALMWMIENDGKPFESETLKILTDTVGIYPIGTWLELSTGEMAEVVCPTPNNPMKPQVKVVFGPKWEWITEPKIIDLSQEVLIHIQRVVDETEIPKERGLAFPSGRDFASSTK